MPVSGSAALPARLSWQPWLGVLLPFTAIGLLPWWVCLALCAALALSTLGEELNSIGALLVLLAAVAVSLPLLFGAAPGRLFASGTLFAQTAVVGLLALASLRALEGGLRRGLLLPAAALLLFPSPLGLPALLIAALGLSGADSRPRLRLESPSRGRTLALVVGAALALVGAGLLLGQVFPAAPVQTATTPGKLSVPSSALPSQPPPTATQTGGSARPRAAPQLVPPPEEDQSLLLRPLVPLTGLLIVVCILLVFQQMRRRQRAGRNHWTGYVALVALLGTLFMVSVLGAGTGPGGFLNLSPPAAQRATGGGEGQTSAANMRPAPAWIAPLLNAGIVFATLFFAAAAVYLYRTLRAERAEQPPALSAAAADGGTFPLPPLHRVRLAWRGLEGVLAGAGLARAESETPEDYAVRLSLLLPAAAADLHTLTRLYLPVRYGGVLSEANATQAEASAERIRGMLAGWGRLNAST